MFPKQIKLPFENCYLELFFDPDEYPVPNRGWFGAVDLSVNGQSYMLNCYDPTSLMQVTERALKWEKFNFEENLVVVEEISTENLIKAAEGLVKSGEFKKLIPSSFKSQMGTAED